MPAFDDRERFLLVWALTVPLVFQCFETKYITYTFPYMMPMALLFARCFVTRELLFRRMTLGCLILCPILLFLVASPLCLDNSAKQEAEAVLSLADESACVAVCKKTYPASLTFYSGREVHRLVTAEEEERLKPEGMAWNSLNVMPFMTFEEMPENRPVLVIVEREREQLFLDNAVGSWELVRELPRSKCYLRRGFVMP